MGTVDLDMINLNEVLNLEKLTTDKKPPFFIVGMPRSGTTLLSLILNNHSEIAVPPETHFFGRFAKLFKKNKLSNIQNNLDFFLNSSNVKDFNLSHQDINNIKINILNNHEINNRVILDSVITSYCKNNNKKYWGEKTPGHVFYLNQILFYFPESKIIQIVRDPRDVTLSLKKVPWEKGNIIEYIRKWKLSMNMKYRCKELNKSNYLEVKYENLISNTKREIEIICRFLGIKFENDMINYHLKKNTNFNIYKEPWKKKNIQPIDSDNKNKWLTEMSITERQVSKIILGDSITKKGYRKDDIEVNVKGIIVLTLLVLQNLLLILKNYIIRIIKKVSRGISTFVEFYML